MRLSRIIIAFLAGFAMLAGPTAAGAVQPQPSAPEEPQPSYPPGPPDLTIRPSSIVLGEAVVIAGSGFRPSELVNITVTVNPLASAPLDVERGRRADGGAVAMVPVAVYRQPAPRPLSARADGDGDFEVNYRPTAVAEYVFTARGRTSKLTATATLTVLRKQPQPTAPSGGLPRTGDSMATTLKVGGGLVALGAVMLMLTLAWRRRRSGMAG